MTEEKKIVNIYKIQPKEKQDEKDCYYGSTTFYNINSRFSAHKSRYFYNLNTEKDKILKTCKIGSIRKIFEKYGPENCECVLVETFDFIDKKHRLEREAYYIKNFPCINNNIPDGSFKQQSKLNNMKKWRENNQEKIKEYAIKYKEKKMLQQLEQLKKWNTKN